MKAAPKSQREMYYDAERRSGEINKTFLEMLPTMRRRDLEKLIEKRPALWGRFADYLTSGHRFVDDPQAHATRKKSPSQLQREIDEALAQTSRARPINKRKPVRHFSEWKDKIGRTHLAVVYEDHTSHPIAHEELNRYREREARGETPRRR